tara:strand:- start:2248 stop:4542 length:2295 start_codon:yes stop_codon:yes gene_type:complete
MVRTVKIVSLFIALTFISCSSIYEGVVNEITKKVVPKASENPEASATHGAYSSLPERIEFYPDNTLTPTNFSEWVAKELQVTIQPTRELQFNDGSTNTYYQQLYKGYPVDGSSYILHRENGKATYANGLLFDSVDISVGKTLSTATNSQIIHAAYQDVQIVDTEGPLILAGANEAKNKFWFCYKTLVFNEKDKLPYQVYVDINRQNVLKVVPVIHAFTEPGKGTTTTGKQVSFNTEYRDKISGQMGSVTIEKLESGFRLYDSIRKIHTVSANNLSYREDTYYKPTGEETITSTGFTQILYESDLFEKDNIWSDAPAAVEAHWGSAMTYDYFKDNFNREGMDNSNGYLKVAVNYSKNYIGAHYNSNFKYLVFGDGHNDKDPLTDLDIVAHEYSHGVTYSYADMNFNGESGSITEAISDIFAVAVTFYEGNGDWSIGERVIQGKSRNIKDPKANGRPDTYKGEYWQEYPTSFELSLDLNKGKSRHQNGTVLSHWFYLLSEGGKGENDNEDYYEIEKIGMEKAANIVYNSYQDLIPSITFRQYRDITLSAAKRLYGECSNEMKQVTNSWYAVGLGDPVCDCFEGSLVYHIRSEGKENSAKYYFKEDKIAVELATQQGGTIIQYTSKYDRYWHLKGHPDLEAGSNPMAAIMKEMVQGKRVYLINQPKRFATRKEYTAYKNQHKTGNVKEVEGYRANEYVLEGTRFWATEDVCLSLADLGGTLSTYSQSIKDNNRAAFFGFPIEMYYEGSKIWIDSIKEEPIDNSFFSE